MRAGTRWALSLAGAFLIVCLTLGLFLFAGSVGETISRTNCLDHSGRWDYTERRCYLPRQSEDR